MFSLNWSWHPLSLSAAPQLLSFFFVAGHSQSWLHCFTPVLGWFGFQKYELQPPFLLESSHKLCLRFTRKILWSLETLCLVKKCIVFGVVQLAHLCWMSRPPFVMASFGARRGNFSHHLKFIRLPLLSTKFIQRFKFLPWFLKTVWEPRKSVEVLTKWGLMPVTKASSHFCFFSEAISDLDVLRFWGFG